MTTLQSTAPPFDDVWRTIQELALMSKETDRQLKETDRQVSAAMRGVDYVFHAAALKGALVRVLSHAGGAHQCAGHRKCS